jgi:protein involved in polysaccharide export with SLBB domain
MPMIPKPLKIAGLTEVDASGLIARAYSEAQIIHDPQVSVLRLENRSATYAVLGSGAARPGEYAIDTPDFRLTKALAFAGARLGGQTSVVIVRKNGSGKNRRLVIPTAQLIAGDASVNVVMRAGDTVVLFPPGVPTDPPVADAPTTAAADLGQYYVGGPAVKRPGVYTIPPRNISVCQAIIAAGLQGDEEYVEIGRRDGGKAEWFMHGKYSVNDPGPLSGVLLQPKDTVMVKPTPFESATTQAAPAP